MATAAIVLAVPACGSRPARERQAWRQFEPVVHQVLAAERDAFVRGDAEAALRTSGLDTAHWSAVRVQLEEVVRRRELLVRRGHRYHAVLESRTTVDSGRVTGDSATLWVTGLSVYAHRTADGDSTAPPTMGEAVPHVLAFVRRLGTWVLVRDSIISDAELHRRHRAGRAAAGPPVDVAVR